MNTTNSNNEAMLGGGGTHVASVYFKACYVAIWRVGYVPAVISLDLTIYM